MMKTYYHATPYENLASIMREGIRKGFDDCVYLTTDPEDAAKFLAIRGCNDIIVLEVRLDEDDVEESFDHSERFFKCRAYMYSDKIYRYQITNILHYKRKVS